MTQDKQFPQKLPIIIEQDTFLFPFMIAPLFLYDKHAIEAANHASKTNSPVLVVSANKDGFYKMGVVGTIMRKISLPDKATKILFRGFARGIINSNISDENNFLSADVDLVENEPYSEREVFVFLDILKDKVSELSQITNAFPQDISKDIDEKMDPEATVDLIASAIKLRHDDAYALFSQTNLQEKIISLIAHVTQGIENAKLQKEIKKKVHNKIDKVNKEYFLKEQLKQIRRELGEDNQRNEEIQEYREKLAKKKKSMSEEALKEVEKQIERFSRMHPDSADANTIQTYIEWALDVPFGVHSAKKLSIKNVEDRLDKDHYSLKKAKSRISEFFASKELLALRGLSEKNSRGTILCFIGPPGVGKTSLANSISTALKRSLVRIALGGMEDVNELRGHRRTYIGAMPGRIVQGLIEAKSFDPVVVLDEIDKIGRNFRGDPSAVLLEILDPEQNSAFRDYYLNFNIDLSKIIFIATANDVGEIPSALRDRLEIIELSSYTPLEKFEIAKRYLIPQELKKHGLKRAEFTLSDKAITEIIDHYTKEAGVRELRRKVASIMRKATREFLLNKDLKKISVSTNNLEKFLDKSLFEKDELSSQASIGVVNGLAWTAVGGDVLQIEASKIKGKGNLELTGNLGDVMKESSKIALTLIQTMIDAKKLNIKDGDSYKIYDLHIHVPKGATPKDGPSAGITMATAIASILSEKPVRHDFAMTGELTLTGNVLPIGGLKEKLIAAHKAKLKNVIIPQQNYDHDLDDIAQEVLEDLKIIPVKKIKEVIDLALLH